MDSCSNIFYLLQLFFYLQQHLFYLYRVFFLCSDPCGPPHKSDLEHAQFTRVAIVFCQISCPPFPSPSPFFCPQTAKTRSNTNMVLWCTTCQIYKTSVSKQPRSQCHPRAKAPDNAFNAFWLANNSEWLAGHH